MLLPAGARDVVLCDKQNKVSYVLDAWLVMKRRWVRVSGVRQAPTGCIVIINLLRGRYRHRDT